MPIADGRAVYGLGLQSFACWDCGFKSCRGTRCLSVVEVDVSPVRWADHSSSGVLPSVVCLKCDREASRVKRPFPIRGCRAMGKIKL